MRAQPGAQKLGLGGGGGLAAGRGLGQGEKGRKAPEIPALPYTRVSHRCLMGCHLNLERGAHMQRHRGKGAATSCQEDLAPYTGSLPPNVCHSQEP